MIVTDKFIMLNFPKTGSTFARVMVMRAHGVGFEPPRGLRKFRRWRLRRGINGLHEFYQPNNALPDDVELMDQHGAYSQAPARFNHLPVVMLARNPLDVLVSMHLFRWAQSGVDRMARLGVTERFPGFPDLSFAERVDLYYDFLLPIALKGREPKTGIGWQTYEFIRILAKDPGAFLQRLDRDYIESGQYKDDLPATTLLPQENLNEALKAFLLANGYSNIDFIDAAERVQPNKGTTRASHEFMDHYTPDLEARVREAEWALYRILEDFGFRY